jgi:hypothetical protein
MMKLTGVKLTGPAAAAGVNRRFLQRLIARLGLRAAENATDSEQSDED